MSNWIDITEYLPNTLPYLKSWPYTNYKLDEYKFKVRLTNGTTYHSYFTEGKWKITERNPKFIVKQWQPPTIRA